MKLRLSKAERRGPVQVWVEYQHEQNKPLFEPADAANGMITVESLEISGPHFDLAKLPDSHRRLIITRRAVLKGLGAAVALPWLESLAHAAEKAKPAQPPVRLGFVYVPNGVDWQRWHMETAGPLDTFSKTLEPLADVKKELLVFRGLTLNEGRDHGDGGGDHPRATSSFLTAAHPFKSFDKDIRVGGISVDQLAAQKLGHLTRLPSLELACDRPTSPGMCDAGYSGVYRNAISWRTPTSPVPTEINPRLAFFRLFGDPSRSSAAARGRQRMVNSSVLDLVLEDSKKLGTHRFGDAGDGRERSRLPVSRTKINAPQLLAPRKEGGEPRCTARD